MHAADATAGKGDFWILKTGYAASPKNLSKNVLPIKGVAISGGDAPDFVEVGEAGIAMDDAMRRQRRVQLVG